MEKTLKEKSQARDYHSIKEFCSKNAENKEDYHRCQICEQSCGNYILGYCKVKECPILADKRLRRDQTLYFAGC